MLYTVTNNVVTVKSGNAQVRVSPFSHFSRSASRSLEKSKYVGVAACGLANILTLFEQGEALRVLLARRSG
jgi:hypothetical protein